MRTKSLVLASAILSLGSVAGFAQMSDPSPTASPENSPPPPPPGGDHMRGGGRVPEFIEKLPPDVKDRFMAARQKALEDPKILDLKKQAEAANHAFFDAMRAKMKEVDPGLEEVIKQYVHHGPGPGGGGSLGAPAPCSSPGAPGADKGPGPGGPGAAGPGKERPEGPFGFNKLSDAEKAQVKAAHEKAMTDPAVQAAEARKKAATTPEERRAAGEAFHQAMHDAMLKADPNLEPVLKKLGPPQGPPPPPNGGDDQMAPPPPPPAAE